MHFLPGPRTARKAKRKATAHPWLQSFSSENKRGWGECTLYRFGGRAAEQRMRQPIATVTRLLLQEENLYE